MAYFLSCDWGSSSFRLRLVDNLGCKILAEERSDTGIADTFSRWTQLDKTGASGKLSFFLDVIKCHIHNIEMAENHTLQGLKLIVSGMAASSLGFLELPYSQAPLLTDGTGLKTALIPANKDFEHDMLVISGVKTENDVMRGEETQLIGCIDSSQTIKNELFILPGTHSKHIYVHSNQIIGIKTYMTGDFFELLSEKSVLKDSVSPGNGIKLSSFISGVRDSRSASLLHTAFKVRTNQLFDICTKQENFDYLSGLLIGAELNELKASQADTINLLCGSNLKLYYDTAIDEAGLSKRINKFDADWVDQAAVRGHYKIARRLNILQ